jgi:hypothetical protein
MQGLQDRTRLHATRARNLHARTLAPREGEGVAHQTTLGHPSRLCAGGGSTAFSGDRAQARRKAVDAPEAPDPEVAGAPAPVPKHQLSLAPWQSLAVVCACVIAELGRRRGTPSLALEASLRRAPASAKLSSQAAPLPVPGERSEATAGGGDAKHRATWSGP